MNILGITHKNTPVSLRECFSFDNEKRAEFLRLAKACAVIKECVLLSTCNRTEIYFTGGAEALDAVRDIAASALETDISPLMDYMRIYRGEPAVRHLHRVACGMESMILGEDEILGQVKDAYAAALEAGTAGHEINLFFKSAVTCAKRIKTDTEVSKTPVSVGTLAARAVFAMDTAGRDKRVLIIGVGGKTGAIIAKNLLSHGGVSVIGTSRGGARPHGTDGIRIIDYADRYDHMEDADAVISATGSPHFTVTLERLRKAVTKTKPRLFIDVSVPQDIDGAVASFEGAELYNIDRFERLSRENNAIKARELERADGFIDEAVNEALKTAEFSRIVPALDLFEGRTASKLLFAMRDCADAEEMRVIADVAQRIAEGEGKR